MGGQPHVVLDGAGFASLIASHTEALRALVEEEAEEAGELLAQVESQNSAQWIAESPILARIGLAFADRRGPRNRGWATNGVLHFLQR